MIQINITCCKSLVQGRGRKTHHEASRVNLTVLSPHTTKTTSILFPFDFYLHKTRTKQTAAEGRFDGSDERTRGRPPLLIVEGEKKTPDLTVKKTLPGIDFPHTQYCDLSRLCEFCQTFQSTLASEGHLDQLTEGRVPRQTQDFAGPPAHLPNVFGFRISSAF